MEKRSDFLVIGSGIAGLSFALKAAQNGTVSIITKRAIRESATFYAQGGIASVISKEDTFDSHIKDTLYAGAGLCREDIVALVVKDGPARIHELIELGVKFSSRVNGHERELDLGREGGHSKRRIVHAEDLTGKAVEEALVASVETNPNIKVFENHIAIDLLSHAKFVGPTDEEGIWGAYALDKTTGEVNTFLAKATLLATGGAGKVYLYTSNPDIATGDGIAMAYRAGADIANMEFIQFHPTCLYHSKAKSFLISEALRGEGGVLRLKDNDPFMKRHHPMADLAPRDIVARAIDFELKKSGDDCVYLDMTSKPAGFLRDRFPNIHTKCLEFGIDMTKEPIPVVPAAHYTCGGVVTGADGLSTLKRLYVAGESACTGLHGANRLASNSLLESLVIAERASRHAGEVVKATKDAVPSIPAWEPGGAVVSDEAVVITQNWDEIRRFMWNYVGIVRSDKRLERAERRINLLKDEINDYYWDFKITNNLIELRNISTVAELIIKSARLRKESRGLHYNIDYPEKDDANFLKDTVLRLPHPTKA
ncbi:MAG: L-aspartate oxidase [Deltaproteobacteria bacterium GWC2_56_8]|nr:MAG: L-aspartate oxidase [Deltaproteobacteria bacterium GWB2_55_19]OGP33807.1 MAG: L-aspartate oxidase [Deltaproteobacteria bacterium GWC2_56_8]HAO94228.1 L-aspartate oxidase [Deltaproteobacteria bacterium]